MVLNWSFKSDDDDRLPWTKEAKISGRASGDEKTPESGNGLRNCIFEALLFAPPDTNA